MYDKLKALNVDRLDLDEAVALRALACSIKQEYELHALEQPRWLQDAARALDEEIARRRRDSLLRRRSEVKARLDGLKPASEKRRELARELKSLDAKLA